jgi:hypothetical protein
MNLVAAVAAIAVAASMPVHASAGCYDRTTWGMSLEQVQKLYPNGTKQRTPDGEA